jgi:outer membrane biosynthesis protein TonB
VPNIEEVIEEKPKEKPEVKQEKEIEQPEEVQKEVEEVEEIPEEIPEEPKPVVNQRALFKGATSSNAQSSEGITGKPGDQGRPDGLKDVKRYDGQGGKGNGPSFSLGGRGAKYLEVPTREFSEQGDVVVEIWVDKNGIVKKASVSAKGTTVIDPDMRNIAVRAALNSTFSEDPTATELQKGTITYTFIIRR